MATQHRAVPTIPPLPAELQAMCDGWDNMSNAIWDAEADRYERAKNEFEMLNRGFRNGR